MNKTETIKTAFNMRDPEEQKKFYTDDYQFTDSVGSPPMDLNMWFGMGELMKAAMPDADYIVEDIREDGDDVLVTGHFTGTFKNDFNLSALNMGVIPATGKFITFPSSTSRVSFNGGKISRQKDLSTGPNAGTAGFIATLSA